MLILLTNVIMYSLTGSEQWTRNMVTIFKKLGHEVDLYVFNKKRGPITKDLLKQGINIYYADDIPKKNYDIIFANHTSCLKNIIKFHNKNKIIQTVHGLAGVAGSEEEPFPGLFKYISVSKEVQQSVLKKNIKSTLIPNSVDCNRFNVKKPINDKLKNVIFIGVTRKAWSQIQEVCKELKLNLTKLYRKSLNIENEINENDLVITIGRSTYEALSCGRNVISCESRYGKINPPIGHGLLKSKKDIENAIFDNFTGRTLKENRFINKKQLEKEILKYDKKYGDIGRKYMLENLNTIDICKKYIELSEK